MATDTVIEITGLEKSFGTVKAVDGISFKVKKGELFAFLGENGAGKSTTISIICASMARDGGFVAIDGKDADKNREEIKRKLGVVFQGSVLDKPLSVRENLKSRAALYGIFGEEFETRYRELDALLGLDELKGRDVGKLSGGQRRRADIARALIHSPEILILDEPTTGLDPQTRKNVWDVVNILRREKNMTVFFTTHYMEEAAEADYIVIIDAGKKAAEGTPLQLKNQYAEDCVMLYGADKEDIDRIGMPYTRLRDGYRIPVKDTAAARRLVTDYPDIFNDFEIIKGKMDDVFLAVTGRKLHEENK